jgi:hypothetical protein
MFLPDGHKAGSGGKRMLNAECAQSQRGMALEGERPRMTLVENERIKLTANALDRLSTVCLAAGAATPFATVLYGQTSISFSHLAAGCYIWIFAAVSLHRAALRTLGMLAE